MKKNIGISIVATVTLALSLVFVFLGSPVTHAAASPDLGAASTFGILSDTYSNTALGTTVNGDLGYTTGPALSPTVNGTTHVADGTYNQAGLDQGTALNTLNSQPCTFNFGSATDLSLLSQPLLPGVYCIIGAATIGTGGITLSGAGTYLFRMDGALDTVANSSITFVSGASACDLFWTPTGATTLGANSTFSGTDIDAAGITMGSNVTWTGRALAFGGTVTTATDTISVPSCAATTGTTTTPGLSLTKTSNPTTYTSAGQNIVYTFVIKNTGNVTLTGPFTVTDDKLGTFSCGSATSLAASTSVTCTKNYVIKASDLGNVVSMPVGVVANINTGAWLSFVNSTQDTKISGASPAVPNGTYSAWCIQDHTPTDLHNQPAKLYSTTGGSLPSDVASLHWNQVNYVLNHKIRGVGQSNLAFLKDVQTAIWVVLGEQNPEFGISANAHQMINAANANASFVSGPNDITAGIIYSDGIRARVRPGEIQESIIEMTQLKTIVNHATGSAKLGNVAVSSSQVQATIRQVR